MKEEHTSFAEINYVAPYDPVPLSSFECHATSMH
jgi:hypothetical protein